MIESLINFKPLGQGITLFHIFVVSGLFYAIIKEGKGLWKK